MFANKLISQFLCCAFCVAYLVIYALIRVPKNFISAVILLGDNHVLMLMLVSFSVSPATIGYECHMSIHFFRVYSVIVSFILVCAVV